MKVILSPSLIGEARFQAFPLTKTERGVLRLSLERPTRPFASRFFRISREVGSSLEVWKNELEVFVTRASPSGFL